MSEPTISVAIPTYNRAAQLAGLLDELTPFVRRHSQQIEIVIADNASSDETAELVRRHVEALPDCIHYYRQPSNLGVSRNLVSLFYRARGKYLLFIGDDDRIVADGVERILELARSTHPPIGFVQWQRWGAEVELTYAELARDFFYDYGNAYLGCVDRAAAVEAIESRGLRDRIEQTVWPQTVMGMLAIHDHPHQPVVGLDRAIGYSAYENLSIKTFDYYERSLGDLIAAAMIVDEYAHPPVATRSVIRWRNRAFRTHVQGMLVSMLTEQVPRPRRWSFVARLVRAAGLSGMLTTAGVMLLLSKPSGALIFYLSRLTGGSSLGATRKVLREIASQKEKARMYGVRPGVRFGNDF